MSRYANDLIEKNDDVGRQRLTALYREHRQRLRVAPKHADVYAKLAVVLLKELEEDPRRWEAIRWLNSSPSPEGQTFREYLSNWRQATPERHRPFVDEIAGWFEIELEGQAAVAP